MHPGGAGQDHASPGAAKPYDHRPFRSLPCGISAVLLSPTIALREGLLNAFAHWDYTIPGMVFIRHYRDRFEINSPGGFTGGVTPENIRHHAPVTRNRYLVETVLLATRLVNRQNLGVPRIFRALLEEGKEPPAFDEIGQMVRVTFPGQKADQPFKVLLSFLTEKQGAYLDVDDLLLLHCRKAPAGITGEN